MSRIRQAFRDQAAACAALGSPLMQRLMAGLADALSPGDPVSDCVLAWPGDPSSRADSVPLRLAGGLHALVLSDRNPALARAYASGEDPTAAALAAMDAAGRHGPIARLAMEADDRTPGAALTLTLWPDGETVTLGRADFHGRWIDWQAP